MVRELIYFVKIVAAITPGLSLLTYFYLKDKYSPEPMKLVLRMFICGGLIVFPLLFVQEVMNRIFTSVFTQSFIVSGFTEEFAKWLLIYFVIFSHSEFDEHFDGIVYAVATAVGFATVENLFYIFLNQGNLFNLIWLRALLPVSGHALFGVTMGYYMGKMKKKKRKIYLLLSLLLPVLFHGIFNSMIYLSSSLAILLVLFMTFLWVFNLRKMNAAIEML